VNEEVQLSQSDMAAIAHLLPDPEPPVVARTDGTIIPIASVRLDGNERKYVLECLESTWISSQGPFVTRFEEAFATAVGCRHGIACSSGTAALHLILAALGLRPGDEVLVPTATMIAVANTVAHTGATPVFVDAHLATWNMDLEALEAAITPRTRAIVAVHTYGHALDMERVTAIAARHGLLVVEDAAEAHGATRGGAPVGSLGAAAAFSFYGNKIVTTGDGGMVTTNDARLADAVRSLRDHAFSKGRHFWHTRLAFNYRMSGLQAAIGLAQVERFDELVAIRRANAARYDTGLAEIPGIVLPPREDEGCRDVAWMYGVLVTPGFGLSRDELRRVLALRGIETRTFFVPLHLQPVFYRREAARRLPVAETIGRQGLLLPSGATLTPADIDEVVRAVAVAPGLPPSNVTGLHLGSDHPSK
jgi:perosamine synthetase